MGNRALDETSGVSALLAFARAHLDMDVAFVSEFVGQHRHFRYVDAGGWTSPVELGGTAPLAGSLCAALARDELPTVVPDLARYAVAEGAGGDIPAAGSHIGVPVYRRNGKLYGTLCLFSRRANTRLRGDDANLLTAVASVITDLVTSQDQIEQRRQETISAVRALVASGGPATVFQPIVDLRGNVTLGMEALSRFPAGSPNPAEWFAMAHDADPCMGIDLELQAMSNSIAYLPSIKGFLSVNISPSVLMSARFDQTLRDVPRHRLVLEITEHEPIEDYELIARVLRPHREAGIRVAVDDTGAGFASMRHVLKLAPDIIKLDISLVHRIDENVPQQAFASATLAFAQRTGATVLAEGVETSAEKAALVDLGIVQGQGYYTGRPRVLDGSLNR